MNKAEAAKVLGISQRTLQRRMHSGALKFSKVGAGVSFTYADLGLPEPEQKPQPERRVADLGPLAVDLTGERSKDDAVVPPKITPRLDCTIEEMDQWSIDDLRAARLIWCKVDDPNGPPTNAPAIGSGSMPSPENFQRFSRANDLIFKDEVARRPRVPVRREYYGQRCTVSADCAAHNSRVANLGRE